MPGSVMGPRWRTKGWVGPEAESAGGDGIDRRGRFDLREGHDLERLLWPGMGSGDSTGLLQNLAVDGRHLATDEPI